MTYTLTEKVDRDALQFILDNYREFPLILSTDDETVVQAQYTYYTKYLNSIGDDGNLTVVYKPKPQCPRFFADRSCLTTSDRHIRHTIARDYHIDVDIKNCHPCFLKYLCTTHGLPHQQLDVYLERRDEVLTTLAQKYKTAKGCIKAKMLAAINGGVSKRINDQPLTELYPFFDEMKVIHKGLCKAHPDLYQKCRLKALKKKARDEDSFDNPAGMLINYLLCDLESKSLSVMVDVAATMGLEVASLAYDGLTLCKEEVAYKKLPAYLAECSAVIKQRVGVDVTIVEKPMDEGFTLPEGYKEQTARRCRCPNTHPFMTRFLNAVVKALDINTPNDDFYRLVAFVDNELSACGPRFSGVFLRAANSTATYDEMVDTSCQYTPFTWEDLREVLPTSKKNKPFTRLCEESILHKNATTVVDTTPEAFVDPTALFDPHDHLNQLQQHYLYTVFPSWKALLQDFAECCHKYLRFVSNPRCIVENHGADGFVIKAVEETCASLDASYRCEGNVVAAKPIQEFVFGKNPRTWTCFHRYSHIVFDPNPNTDYLLKNALNTYTGFQARRVETVDKPRIAFILNHIWYCWACEDPTLYHYILSWFHAAWTRPWEKIGVVLLLLGDQGTGKGVLLQDLIIPYVYGSYGTQCVGLGPIIQRFNSIIDNKLFLTINEVSSNGDAGFMDKFEKLKALITDQTITIENKHRDTKQAVPSFLQMIMTTNNQDAVRVEKSDRRYCCIRTSSRFKGDHEYFADLVQQCSQDTANHFYTYICDLKSPVNPRCIPKTDLRDDMQVLSSSSVERFLHDVQDCITADTSPNQFHPWWVAQILYRKTIRRHKRGFWLQGNELFKAYTLWCTDTHERHTRGKHKFLQEMRQLVLVERAKVVWFQVYVLEEMTENLMDQAEKIVK